MNNKIKNNIRVIRETRGWSQVELAARAGVSLSWLNHVEVWNFSIRPRSAQRLAEALSVGIEDLFPKLPVEGKRTARRLTMATGK